MRVQVALIATLTVLGTLASGAGAYAAPSSGLTTAWRDGRFGVDARGVVSRSDVVLGQANAQPSQAMPLGNGSLGAGVWAAGGLTAQLNRADTLPDRKSPGQLTIPGLGALSSAPTSPGASTCTTPRWSSPAAA